MKKALFSLFTALFFIACEGPMGPMGPEGPEGPQGEPGTGTYWYTTSITVNEGDWQLYGEPNDLNSYYYVEKPLGELTERIYEEGTVIAYIETEYGRNGMPLVLHKAMVDDIGEYFWTQTYDFDYLPGSISFRVTYSDFITSAKPGRETFHVVLMW